MDLDSLLNLSEQYPFLEMTLAGNTIWQYLVAFFLFWLFFFGLKFIQMLAINQLKKLAELTKTNLDDTIVEIINSLRPPFYYFISFYFATKTIHLNEFLVNVLDGLLIVWIILQSIQIIQIFISTIARNYIASGDKGDVESAVQALNIGAKILLWAFGILLILSNLGFDVTSLMAGLGIGGIAIAFAVQGILSDLFSSFTLYFDKPFKIGDFIVVGDKAGIVEKIGIKTSRIRALQGEEIIIPNQDLTASHIQNFKQMEKRRIAFDIGVTYSTTPKQMKKIPKIIEDIISKQDQVKFDRAHFKTFGDYALIFEVVYHVLDRDFNTYMDAHQKINLEILTQFNKHKISIAFPTQTLHLKK